MTKARKGAIKDEVASATTRPKSRRKRRAVASAYQQLSCELLRIKEEFLKRNESFAREVEELYEQLPGSAVGTKWTAAQRKRLWRFILKWDTAPLHPEDLRKHPYGSNRWLWNEVNGVVELSGPESNLVVIGIDVRHDADEIADYVRELVRDVRTARQNAGEPVERWKPFRLKSKFVVREFPSRPDHKSVTRRRVHHWQGGIPERGEEAIHAWEMGRRGFKLQQICNYLFPELANLPAGDPRAEFTNGNREVESGIQKARERLQFADKMIAGDYRHILPLTGVRSRMELIQQWEESRGGQAGVPTRKGGASQVGTKRNRK